MENAIFIARTDVPGIKTAIGPYESEEVALKVAAVLPPGAYTIYGDAHAGKSFSVAAPVITFSG